MPTKKRSSPEPQEQSSGVTKSLHSHKTSPHGSPAADLPQSLSYHPSADDPTPRTPKPQAHAMTMNNNSYMAVSRIRRSLRGKTNFDIALRQMNETSSNNTSIPTVLKLTWQEPSKFQEGQTRNECIGHYGVCQVIYEADPIINDSADLVRSPSNLLPSPRGNVFGQQTENLDTKGAQRNDCRAHSMLLMQPGRLPSQAESPFELLVGIIWTLMKHWTLMNKQVQYQDINTNNILLVSNYEHDFDFEQPEWEHIEKLDELARELEAPKWNETPDDPIKQNYKSIKKLTWEFDPKCRLKFLERTIEVLGPKPFGFLSDMDLVNTLALCRNNAEDTHIHRTGTLSFMAARILQAKPNIPIPHTYLHDLESFFWVLLYTVAEHKEGGAELNEDALIVLLRLERFDPSILSDAKYSLLFRIASGDINIESFDTTWSKALAPMIVEFARWTYGILFEKPDPDSDSHFGTVLTIFLDAAKKLKARLDPGLKEM